MFTREQYINHDCTHSEYYGQFVNQYVLNTVGDFQLVEKIINSKDEHFNDIPLQIWDKLSNMFARNSIIKKVQECGDGYSLSTGVCIAKEAARRIKNIYTTKIC